MAGNALFRLLKITDERAKGIAMGVASHGIGTAQALQSSGVSGAFSGLAMGLNALATAVVIPLLVKL